MKALVLKQNQELSIENLPEPGDIPADHLLIRNHFLALNHLDLFSFRGMAFAKRKLPLVVGVEGSGIIEAVGENVSETLVGKKAVVCPALLCGECTYCRSGREALCSNATGIMGFHVDGLARELMVVPRRLVFEVPENVPLEHAACTIITFATVERMLFSNARLDPGETILIHAGGSGIGSTAIKLAKLRGATVITTVGSEEKRQKAFDIGADHVILYRDERFEHRTRRLTKGEGVDVVFEHVGSDTWEKSLFCLKKGGRLVTCGSTTGVYAQTNLLQLFNNQISIFASFGGHFSNVRDALQRMHDGTAAPVIDSIVPLEDFGACLERMKNRDVFGKLIMQIA